MKKNRQRHLTLPPLSFIVPGPEGQRSLELFNDLNGQALMISASSLRRIPLEPVDAPQQAGCAQVSSSSLHCTKQASLQVWEYTPGRFDSCANADHSACVLSGTAEVALSDGRNVQLKPGTTLYIPRGLRGHWVVETTLRTVALDQGVL